LAIFFSFGIRWLLLLVVHFNDAGEWNRENLHDFYGGERQESGTMTLAIRSDYSSFRVVMFRGPDSADTRRSGPSLF